MTADDYLYDPLEELSTTANFDNDPNTPEGK